MLITIGREDEDVRISIHDCNRAEVDKKIPGLEWRPVRNSTTFAVLKIANVDISFFEEVPHDQEGV